MKALGVLTFLILILRGFGEVDEEKEATSLVKKLTATCGKDGIKVNVRFSIPFSGIVYSDGHYDTPGCVFINQHENSRLDLKKETRFSFLIPADECGTVFHDPGSAVQTQTGPGEVKAGPEAELDNEVYMENTVMFQRNHFIQEQGDLAQKLRCVWQKEIRRPLHATLPLRGKHSHKQQQQRPDLLESRNGTARRRNNPNVSFGGGSHRSSLSTKRFTPKGQVESISFGRRSGKSIEHLEKYFSPDLETSTLSVPNLTALAFKADDTRSGTDTVHKMPFQNNKIILCNYVGLMLITDLLLSNLF